MRKQIPKNKNRRVKETDEKELRPIGAQFFSVRGKAGGRKAGAHFQRTGSNHCYLLPSETVYKVGS